MKTFYYSISIPMYTNTSVDAETEEEALAMIQEQLNNNELDFEENWDMVDISLDSIDAINED